MLEISLYIYEQEKAVFISVWVMLIWLAWWSWLTLYFSDVEASEAPAFDVVLKADKKRLQLLEEASINKWI